MFLVDLLHIKCIIHINNDEVNASKSAARRVSSLVRLGGFLEVIVRVKIHAR